MNDLRRTEENVVSAARDVRDLYFPQGSFDESPDLMELGKRLSTLDHWLYRLDLLAEKYRNDANNQRVT